MGSAQDINLPNEFENATFQITATSPRGQQVKTCVYFQTNESGGFPPAQTEVMFVDASGHTQDANTSEVSISLAVAKSPVRVVCHTDSPVVSNVQ